MSPIANNVGICEGNLVTVLGVSEEEEEEFFFRNICRDSVSIRKVEKKKVSTVNILSLFVPYLIYSYSEGRI